MNTVTLKIAFRNIFRQKRRTILTGFTLVGGFVLSSVSIGWSDGSYSDIINKFTSNQLGHIQIHYKDYRENPSIYKTIDNYERIGEKIEKIKSVKKWTPRLFCAGLVSVQDKSAGAQIIGVDPVLEENATNFSSKIVNGRSLKEKPSHEVVIGSVLLNILEAEIGDSVVVLSQAYDGSIANDEYVIVGSVESNNDMRDRMAFYLHIGDAQELLVLKNRVHEIAVIAGSLDDVNGVVNEIKEKLDNKYLEIVPWQIFAKSFYRAMQADKQGMWIMLFVIILIVSVGVLNSILMSVLERRKEYGVLRALGTTPIEVFSLIIYEVIILTIFSVILGTCIGITANHFLSIYGITLSESMTFGGVEFQTLKSTVNLRSILLPMVAVVFAASIVSIFPALHAARTEPAKSMRMQ